MNEQLYTSALLIISPFIYYIKTMSEALSSDADNCFTSSSGLKSIFCEVVPKQQHILVFCYSGFEMCSRLKLPCKLTIHS